MSGGRGIPRTGDDPQFEAESPRRGMAAHPARSYAAWAPQGVGTAAKTEVFHGSLDEALDGGCAGALAGDRFRQVRALRLLLVGRLRHGFLAGDDDSGGQ